MRVKREYDVALDDALAAVYDNVNMRASLAAAEERLEQVSPADVLLCCAVGRLHLVYMSSWV